MITKPLEDYLELEESHLILISWKQFTARASLLTKGVFYWMGWRPWSQVRGP